MMVSKKILITGPPKSGKSTLILKIKDYFYNQNYKIYGFLTPEVMKNGKRIGFDILDISTGEIAGPLARSGSHNTFGKYRLFIDKFDKFLAKIENFQLEEVDLILIDEIGKMELYSPKFQDIIMKVFQSNISIIATIGEKMQHPIKEQILNLQNMTLFNLTRKNREEILKKIISIIEN